MSAIDDVTAHFNQLHPHEAERLAVLLEEMAESTQIIGKILRHGYESCNPTDPLRTTNRQLLEVELGHVRNALDMMLNWGDLNFEAILTSQRAKKQSVKKYLHHQEIYEP